MVNYKRELEEQLKQLNELVKQSNKNIARYKDAPTGQINLSKCRGNIQYYYIDKVLAVRKYLNNDDCKLIKKLVQRDYDLAINKKLKELHWRLQKFINTYDIDDITNIYSNLLEGRKRFVEPLVEPLEQYVTRWRTEHPGQQNSFPEDGIYQTNRGEMVRSKSEKIIADALEKYRIPYQYEPMLELGFNTIYPDFVVLNCRTRKTMYWEHLGIVSNEEYAVKNFRKLQSYERNGYLLGRDLIITMESSDMPIDVTLVEQKIKEFLL